MNKVIVVGGNHHNTLGVIRSLGRQGIAPIVIVTSGGKSSFVLKSKYIKEGYYLPGSKSAIAFMKTRFADGSEKPIVIPCHDAIASEIDQQQNVLSQYFYLHGTNEQGKITSLMDKNRMGELAIKVGLNVPETKVFSEVCEIFNHNIEYPCITKPLSSKDGSKNDIVICRNQNDLINFFSRREGRSFVVQKYINKKYEYQFIGCSINSGANIIIPGVAEILRPSKASNTGFLRYKPLDNSYTESLNKAFDFIKSVGYSGLFSMEFMRGLDGRDYFMEMNFRNDGNAIAVTNAGVNLSYIWCLSCAGERYENQIMPVHEEYVMPEFAELYLYRQKGITRKEWKSDMTMATSYMDFDKDDLKPTNGWKKYKKERVVSYIKFMIKKMIFR